MTRSRCISLRIPWEEPPTGEQVRITLEMAAAREDKTCTAVAVTPAGCARSRCCRTFRRHRV